MAKKKIKIALIGNKTTRKVIFNQRKKGLLKKVSELTTLCGVNAGIVLYSPYSAEPDVWPSPTRVNQILTDFNEMSEIQHSKKMLSHEAFLEERLNKINNQLEKLYKKNRDNEVMLMLSECLAGKSPNNLDTRDLKDLECMIHQLMTNFQENKYKLEETSHNPQEVGKEIQPNSEDDNQVADQTKP